MIRRLTIRDARGSQDKQMIAELLFEQDTPFVPVTSLQIIDSEHSTFFGACIDGTETIRACASYTLWLTGCNEKKNDPSEDTQVFELASTLVRKPMGGFKPPMATMQQLLAFARIMGILGAEFDQPQGYFSLIACIASNNVDSLRGMTNIGMKPVVPIPRWLEYEHRTWFPKVTKKERVIESEAQYLWLPSDAAKTLIEKMIPIDEGKILTRTNMDDDQITDEFKVEFETESILALKSTYGTLRSAAEKFRYDILRPPPKFARLGDGFF